MRVLHLIPDLTMGGAEMLVVNLLLAMDQRRWTPRIVSMFGPHHNILEERLAAGCIEVRSLRKRMGPDPRMLWRLEREIREFKPDVIHTHRYVLGYLAPLLAARRTPAVHTCHTLAQHETGRRGKSLYRMAWRAGSTPIAISNQVARSVTEVYGIERMPVILNGIPVEQFRHPTTPPKAWRRAEGFTDSEVLIVCIGRLSAVKNHPLLINTFDRIADQIPDARLLIVGDGEERDTVEALVRSLSATDRIQLMGQRNDISDILHAADLLVLTSTFEGIPLTIQEAMAAGTPVLATAVGGVPELVVHEESGLLVDSGDFEALGKALIQIVNNEDMRMDFGQRSREIAAQSFDISLAARAYERVYDAVVSNRDPVVAAAGTGLERLAGSTEPGGSEVGRPDPVTTHPPRASTSD